MVAGRGEGFRAKLKDLVAAARAKAFVSWGMTFAAINTHYESDEPLISEESAVDLKRVLDRLECVMVDLQIVLDRS